MSIKVYKASAGSGKTYTLVYEYIRFLFQQITVNSQQSTVDGQRSLTPSASLVPLKQGDNIESQLRPLNLHRGILAVTFTNKATAEMKERIVKGLYNLSEGGEKDYRERLRLDVMGLRDAQDEAISTIAKRLLTDILQDYTQFRISTIDGFFQQVVRSFARELNLNSQYQVELETDKVLEMAVDNMLASLNDSQQSTVNGQQSLAPSASLVPLRQGDNMEGQLSTQLLDWLTEFAAERVDSEKSWNPRGAILELANLITTEGYLSQKADFGFDLERLKVYRNNIREIIRKFDADLKLVCDRAQRALCGVDGKEMFGDNRISRFDYDYLKGKKYELSATFVKGADDDDLTTWCKKKYQKDVALQGVVAELHLCAKRIVELCQGERFVEYQTAQIVNSYIYILGILNEIDKHAMEICRAKDCLLLSSTSDFINKIIDGSDTPFIYEKVGVRTEHFMIDEFQDTSRLQWSNFLPLLKDAVAQGNESMIVGDVKQSIYRWRNGDWRILHEGIKGEFGDYVKNETLGENYRSSEEVIEFNKKLYVNLPKLADEQLRSQNVIKEDVCLQGIYTDVEQKVGRKDAPRGYVRVEFLVDDEEDKELTWKVQSLNKMVESMNEIGAYGDMAVLVRTNSEAKRVAERLREEGIPFYSSEALCVADDAAVRFVLAVLEYLMQPHESLFRANVVALHREVCRGRGVGAEDYELMAYRGNDYADWERLVFGDEVVAERFARVKYMSLLSMIEALIGLFDLSGVDGGVHGIYLQSFLDKVQAYAINGTLDIRSLLEYWKIQGEKTFVAMPEGGEAVRIITIHKSKGLEFGVVYIPFMDWAMGLSNQDNIQLVGTQNKSRNNHLFIDEVSVVPVNTRSSKKLLNSEFRNDIVDEFLASCLDVMNVLYVATTRASQQLFLHCNEPKSEKKETGEIDRISVGGLIRRIFLGKEVEKFLYESNDKVAYQKKEKEDDEAIVNVVLKRDVDTLPTEEEVAARAQLRFKYSEDMGEGDARRYGVMMHRLFEKIVTIDDVDDAIVQLEREGECVDGVRCEVDAILKIEGVSELFDAHWRVMNEAEIFDGANGKVYRPDRVVIDDVRGEVVVLDYKFGEYTDELNQKYTRQVARYMQLIKEMGYNAKGYILYAKERRMSKV